MPVTRRADRSAAAMRVEDHDAPRPWYLGATPLATLPWLIRLRWTTAVIEALAVVAAWSLPAFDLPLDHLTVPLVLASVTNVAVAAVLSRGLAIPRPAAAAAIAVDVVLLTGLLELTGGPLNPFAVAYVVQLTLAALTLGSLWAWLLGGLAAVSYGTLIYWHTQELVPGHHRLNDVPTHVFTLWIAVAVTAELVAYFVVRVSNALARREEELEAMRLQAARTEKLVSLTTLAAGAAHELSTPLGTIALAARELEHALIAHSNQPAFIDDARLIRAEVDRCQAILDQMSGRAGGSAVDTPELVTASDMIADVRERLSPAQSARLQVRAEADLTPVSVPRAGYVQAVLSLVKNAFDATPDATVPVLLQVSHGQNTVRVAVEDRGGGLSADALRRAGEPFYTTKEARRGLGLGLFLARVFAERHGGTLTLESANGTTAILELPLPLTQPQVL